MRALVGTTSAAVEEPSMADVGRNDPCPCGSGKKYKRCHLLVEEAAPAPVGQRARARHQIDERVVSEMLRFGRRYFPDWNPVVEYEELGGNAEHLQLFAPWAVYHCDLEGRPLFERYLESRGGHLPEAEREWLAAQRHTWLSVWEVTDVAPGESVSVRDLLTGEERLVHEVSGSRTLAKRDAMLGRVVDADGVSVFCGVHPQPLPPREAADLVRALRREMGVRSRHVSSARLRERGVDGLLIALWEETSEALRHRPLPEMRNTDGDELLLTVDRFSVVSGARAEVAARLTALDGVETSEQDGVLLLTFTRPGNEVHESWDNTIVGNAELGADEMKVETNSRERADALRQRLEEACAGLLTRRIREHTDLESVLAKSRGEPRQPAMPKSQEELDLLRDFKEKHYAAWVDQPLPGLRGATPLQAIRTARGRKQVELLLKELENGESRLPQGERFDVTVLRRRLGLECKAGASG